MVQPLGKKTYRKKKRTSIPDEVAEAVKERSQSIDELDGYGPANQFHHIRHKSQGGMDIPINILHVGLQNHPVRLHENADAIQKSYQILAQRIDDTFPGSDYSSEEISQILGMSIHEVHRQIHKGFLRGDVQEVEGNVEWYATKEDIKHWLMPAKVREG